MLLIPWWPTSCFLTQENNCDTIVDLPSCRHCQIRAGLLFCFSDRTVSVGPSQQQQQQQQQCILGVWAAAYSCSSAFLCVGVSHTAAPLAFIFVCFLFSSTCLSAMWECLRFQTSVALWDRSSVSAGSVTVSLYQLQCLVEVWVFPKLCFFFYILFYYVFWFIFWSCFVFKKKKIFCSHRHHHHRHLHDHQNKLWQQPDWMDGWRDWRMDGRQTGCCSVWNLRVFLPREEVLFLFLLFFKV